MISLIDNNSQLEIMNFPDGESFVKFDYNNKPINILWRYENDAELMVLAQMYDVMKRVDQTSRMPKNLLIPYLPHARQDREATDNQPFSLKVLFNFLQSFSRGTNTSVFMLDVHSFVFTNFLSIDAISSFLPKQSPMHNIDSSHYSVHLKNEGYDVVICPDKGAEERADKWQYQLEGSDKSHEGLDDGIPRLDVVDFVQCTKTRDPSTGKLSDPSVIDVDVLSKAKKALLVDDIGTGFGTHVQLGNVLKKINPDMQLDIFVTHSSFTRGKEIVLDVFNKVYTTDSLPKGLLQVDDRIVRFNCTEFLPMV
jgi:phosphoribosylpyrophosphate synthetase